jgi:hypothetical protein
MFAKSIRKADRVRRYTIQRMDKGWEVVREQDSDAVQRAHYQDWHRVEWARRMIVLELATLQENGWKEIPPVVPQSTKR